MPPSNLNIMLETRICASRRPGHLTNGQMLGPAWCSATIERLFQFGQPGLRGSVMFWSRIHSVSTCTAVEIHCIISVCYYIYVFLNADGSPTCRTLWSQTRSVCDGLRQLLCQGPRTPQFTDPDLPVRVCFIRFVVSTTLPTFERLSSIIMITSLLLKLSVLRARPSSYFERLPDTISNVTH